MLSKIISDVDAFVWGPVMLVLLVGTGILLTIRCNFLTWRNLPWAIIKTLSKESRTKNRGEGDVSPFSALTTALAAAIGTGNIVGVATAMVSGVLEHWCGCGFLHVLDYHLNFQNVCWQSNTEKSMKRARCPVDQCIQ